MHLVIILPLEKTFFLKKSELKQAFEHASKSLPKGRFTQICTKTFPSFELTSALSLNVTTSEHFIMHHLLILLRIVFREHFDTRMDGRIKVIQKYLGKL